MPETVHPIEDAFHRIQSPMPAETAAPTDDEVGDALCIALWNAGFTRHEVQVAVSDRGILVTGALPSETLRQKAVEAIGKAAGNRLLINEIAITDAPAGLGLEVRASASPAIFVSRFCGLDAPSIGAGVRSAAPVVDAFLSERGLDGAPDKLLIFRNVRPETVTVEVGCAVPTDTAVPAESEIHAGKSPSGPMLSLPIEGDGHGLAAAIEMLRDKALEHGLGEPVYFWQHLPDPHTPWPAGVPVRLHAAWK